MKGRYPEGIISWAQSFFENISPGVGLIFLVFLATLPVVTMRAAREQRDLEFWVFAKQHADAYRPLVDGWNSQADNKSVDLQLIDYQAMERRMLSGFMSGTPVADLMEVERHMIGRVFSGPLEAVGFVDLTERLKREGLMEKINRPSFSPWTTRGRIFGLPHDVHPVLLAYRADIVEAAGIDMGRIETWEDFVRELRPLMYEGGAVGRPVRYLLNIWHTQRDTIEMLLMQAGGGLFNERDEVDFLREPNVEVLARIATWIGGPGRIALDAPRFSASGNKLILDGTVLATPVPDWLAGIWQYDLPDLGGKLKLMPLPAWVPGGRRTSVLGGTMLGISKTARDFEECWDFAKSLYLSPTLAEKFFRDSHIISPVVEHWGLAFYHQPNAYYSGQCSGALFIEQAPHVPRRTSSPFSMMALDALGTVMHKVVDYADSQQISDPKALEPLLRELLKKEEERIKRQIARNVFHSGLAQEVQR